jgi:hypothetical protein
MAALDRFYELVRQIVDEGRAAARDVSKRLVQRLRTTAEAGAALIKPSDASITVEGPEPPVVARLVIEIRSDGLRTIARGALEDVTTDEKVAIRAEGSTPAQLAGALARSLIALPLFAARLARAVKHSEEAYEPSLRSSSASTQPQPPAPNEQPERKRS